MFACVMVDYSMSTDDLDDLLKCVNTCGEGVCVCVCVCVITSGINSRTSSPTMLMFITAAVEKHPHVCHRLISADTHKTS